MTRPPIMVALGPGAAGDGAAWARCEAGGGASPRILRPDPHVVIAAAGDGGDSPGGAPSLATSGALVAVADAALYYRGDLRRRLRDVGAPMQEEGTPAELILAAYGAWGERAAELLEGDFAFVVWDGHRRRLVAARDFLGRRPLYHATPGDMLLLASRASSVVAHPACPRDPDVGALAAMAGGLPELEWATAWRSIRALPGGRTLVAELGRGGRVARTAVARHWTPPTFESGGGLPFAEATIELREAIVAATVERLDRGRPTAVWLSGGWDSPTVYGAGHEGVRRSATAGRESAGREGAGGVAAVAPLAVTMSYAPGDPGREDELVEQIVAHWGERVAAWCDAGPIPLFGDAAGEAACRDLPLAHPYGQWSRVLAAATVAAGARVALDGGGGDQLFQVSPIYLADLVARLRLRATRREWRARGMTGMGWRRFVQYALHPLAPSPLLRLAALARGGRAVPGARHWSPPPWIRPECVRAHGLERFGRPSVARRPGERHAAAESRWYFESAYPQAILLAQAEIVAREGLELRSPLLDRRVIALAARRPREERSDRGQTKRLLRAAARGLVPDGILAPRPSRTGVTSSYFERALRRELPVLARSVIDESALVELGVVDSAVFARAVADLERGGGGPHDVALFYTVQVELWLRAQARSGAPATSGVGRSHRES